VALEKVAHRRAERLERARDRRREEPLALPDHDLRLRAVERVLHGRDDRGAGHRRHEDAEHDPLAAANDVEVVPQPYAGRRFLALVDHHLLGALRPPKTAAQEP
jgi:hypothetical protein